MNLCIFYEKDQLQLKMVRYVSMKDLLEKSNSNPIEILGVGIVKISRLSSKKKIDIVYQKGVGIKLLHKIIKRNMEKIIKKREGILIDLFCNFSIYLHYFNGTQDEIIGVIYLDKKEKILHYSELFLISQKLNQCAKIDGSLIKIKDICNKEIIIPRYKGLSAIFIIASSGHLFFSKINKNKTKLIQHEIAISGFISALLSFSKEIISHGPETKLKQINLGNQNFYLNLRNNAIFAYLVEKQRITETFKRYMHLVSDEFIYRFKERINPKKFNGELTPFRKFESVVDQYFII